MFLSYKITLGTSTKKAPGDIFTVIFSSAMVLTKYCSDYENFKRHLELKTNKHVVYDISKY
jgi:hypothetical protein